LVVTFQPKSLFKNCLIISRLTAACIRWPNLLSTPETFGVCTDGRMSCRHSAPTFFAV